MNTSHTLPPAHTIAGLRRRAEQPCAAPPTVPPTVLEPGQVLSLRRCAGRQLTLLQGRLWLTEPGDPHDHFLVPGQTRVLIGDGPVVVENDSGVAALYRLK